MSSDPYHALASGLAEIGIIAQLQGPRQLVVSSQRGPVWPTRGDSVWLSHQEGQWHLFTWALIGYRIPKAQSIFALCSTCMSIGSTAMREVPESIVVQFSLQRLDDTELHRLYSAATNNAGAEPTA